MLRQKKELSSNQKTFKEYSVAIIGVMLLLAFWATELTKVYGRINLSPWYTVHSNNQKTKCANVRGVFDPIERFHLIDENATVAIGVSVISSPSTFPDGIARYYRLVSRINLNYVQVINTQTGEVEYTLDDVNWGARITAPTVLSNGNVVVSDYFRVCLYTPGLRHRIWIRRFYDEPPEHRDTKAEHLPTWNMPMYGADELPDGRLLVPTGGGMIYILEQRSGNIIHEFDLKSLGIKMDPMAQIYLRCGPGFDGNLVFFVVYEEILLLKYVPDIGLVFRDRYHYGDNQLSSTTPCIDRAGKRAFFSSVPYDSPETPAFQYASNYDNEQFTLRWS